MGERGRYLRRNWFARTFGDRLAPRFRPDMVRRLSVRGRTSGQWRTTPVAVMDHEGARYLMTPFGDADWTRNLRSAGGGRLESRGQVEEFRSVEVPVGERAPLIEEYVRRYGRMPGVAMAFRELPDPADHPTFRIVEETAAGPDAG